LELIKNSINYKNIDISNTLKIFWRKEDNSEQTRNSLYLKSENNEYKYINIFNILNKNIYLNTEDFVNNNNRNFNNDNNHIEMLKNLSMQD
jgi:hypothetical protein